MLRPSVYTGRRPIFSKITAWRKAGCFLAKLEIIRYNGIERLRLKEEKRGKSFLKGS